LKYHENPFLSKETKQAIMTNTSRTKEDALENDLNFLTKSVCIEEKTFSQIDYYSGL
jgi:hypothetical protein